MKNILVQKRDGRKVNFIPEKIEIAIKKANLEVEGTDKISENEINVVVDRISDKVKDIETNENKVVSIEDIQDYVEKELMKLEKYELAKKYVIYREKRSMVRHANTTDDSILSLVRNTNKDVAEENSNKNAILLSTQRDLIAGEISKDIADRLMLPSDVVEAHKKGILHFHDKDYFIQPMFNCCLINIEDMLGNGTVMNGKMVESPKSFQVACTVMTQIIAAIASSQYGGQSVDISKLGKYLRKTYDKYYKKYMLHYLNQGKTEEEAKEIVEDLAKMRRDEDLVAGVQTIQYQINTLMTTNGQSPFVTIYMHVKDNDPYKYEVADIISEILKQRIQGIKNEEGVYVTPAFPKLVYVLDENNSLNGGEFDYLTRLAVKCSAKRLYPDYISAKEMRKNNEGNVFAPMGCRSFLSPWKDENGEYKFDGRFNQGVVSLNLPQIGIVAKGDYDVFWKELDERLDICFKALMARHNALKGTLSDFSPVHWQYGGIARLKKGEKIDKYLYGGYSTISLGYIGLYELSKLMTGKSHTENEGKEFALKVLKYLKETVTKWKNETNIGFALYGTPAESLCYRFARIDKEIFGDIKDITDKGYYTNSYHVDVREVINAFDKLKFESSFQPISNGGCISYIEIPNMEKNLEALEVLVKYIYDNIQYAEFNTKSDYCHKCEYTGEITINDNLEWECPICHNKDQKKMNVTRRTCGYLGENFWNVGKTKEIKQRVMHI